MIDQLDALIQPVVEGLGCELWGIERSSNGRFSEIKVYIDADEGVGIEDCARVSRQVSSLLDVEGLLKDDYTLEVSSPGMDRRLFSLDQYKAYAGSTIKIQLRRPYDGRSKYSGQLKGIEGDEVILDFDDVEILFPYEVIAKANVVPEF